MNEENFERETQLITYAERIAEDILDQTGNLTDSVATATTVLALMGRKIYPEKHYYAAFIRTVIKALESAPERSTL